MDVRVERVVESRRENGRVCASRMEQQNGNLAAADRGVSWSWNEIDPCAAMRFGEAT